MSTGHFHIDVENVRERQTRQNYTEYTQAEGARFVVRYVAAAIVLDNAKRCRPGADYDDKLINCSKVGAFSMLSVHFDWQLQLRSGFKCFVILEKEHTKGKLAKECQASSSSGAPL